MLEATSQAVLRDIFLITGLGLCLGVVIYAWCRRSTDTNWHTEGNVLSRPYGLPDVILALALLGLLSAGLFVKDTSQSLADSEPSQIVAALTLQSIFLIGIIACLMTYMRVFRGMMPGEMFGLRQMSLGRALGSAALWLFGTGAVMYLILLVVYHSFFDSQAFDDTSQDVVESFLKLQGVGPKLLMLFMVVIIAPVVEEVIFRGFLYGVLKRYTDRWFAAIVTAIFFSLIHQHVGSALPLFVLALGFAVAYEATGCLLVPIFMHAIFNGINAARLLQL